MTTVKHKFLLGTVFVMAVALVVCVSSAFAAQAYADDEIESTPAQELLAAQTQGDLVPLNITGVSLLMRNGTIGMELDVKPADGATDLTIQATFLGDTFTAPYVEKTKVYTLEVLSPAKDIAAPITLTAPEGYVLTKGSSSEPLDFYEVSVLEIADAVTADAKEDYFRDFAQAVINYCYWVQNDVAYSGVYQIDDMYFDDFFNSETTVKNAVINCKATRTPGTQPEGVKVAGISVVNLSTASLRVRFQIEDGEEHATTPAGQVTDSKLLLEVSNISPKKYDELKTFKVDDWQMTASVFTWVRAALNSNVQSAQNVARAMYDLNWAYNRIPIETPVIPAP